MIEVENSRVCRRVVIGIAALIAIGVAIGLVLVLGGYDVAADVPHTAPVRALLDLVRHRSIATRAADIQVPTDLQSREHIVAGASLYNEMCSTCHGAPGAEPTELAQGLYPRAPEFAKGLEMRPAESFWVIKHGIKMTAMPAWGRTHPDALIWDMVAFIHHLPGMSADTYKALVKSAPQDHDEMMHHD